MIYNILLERKIVYKNGPYAINNKIERMKDFYS
jgi:hypothetical protein